MKISVFIYIVSNILFVQVLALNNIHVNLFVQLLCIMGILTFGISHGAIDDILYQKNNISISKTNFISKYLIAITAYFILSVVLPNFAVILFLLLSGFHFGQAQFANYDFSGKKINMLLNTSWGSMILLLLFHFNKEILLESTSIFLSIPTFFSWIFLNSTGLLLVFSVIFSSTLITKYLKKEINVEAILFEIILIGLIACSFLLLDPFVSFSLFFIIIHSIETLTHELDYFKKSLGITKLRNFIKSLLPFTVLSLVVTGLILILMYYFGFYKHIPFILLILIASITAPHSFVMNSFYTKAKK